MASTLQVSVVMGASEVEQAIRLKGLVPYLEELISTEDALKPSPTSQEQFAMTSVLDKLRGEKVGRLTVKTLRPVELYEVNIVVAEVGDQMLACPLTFRRVDGKMWAFALKILEFPEKADEIVDGFWAILPEYQPPQTLIDSTVRALEATLRDATLAPFNQFEDALAKEASHVPKCIQTRLAKHRTDSWRGFFQTFHPRAKIRYARSRSITDDAFCSVFVFETSIAPGLVVVTFIRDHEKPLVGVITVHIGIGALQFIPDMLKMKPEKRTEP